MSENIVVVARLRPDDGLTTSKHAHEVELSGDATVLTATLNDGSARAGAYAFDCAHVHGHEVSQAQVFEESGVVELLHSALDGYKATVFAYGQTGAGKTHTVVGSQAAIHSRFSAAEAADEGLLPRSIRHIFAAETTGEHLITVSACELYQEQVLDLLVDELHRSPLAVREHKKRGFFVDGLVRVACRTVRRALSTVAVAVKERQTSSHRLNARSSRSHCIVTVALESKAAADAPRPTKSKKAPPMTYGSVAFVDLAGSERPKESGSSSQVVREAGYINKSLYTLGKVIRRLSALAAADGGLGDGGTVPFRDSKLTKLLLSSLGGEAKALMFGCVSSAPASVPETLRTMQFAMAVKGIRNRPTVQLAPHEQLVVDLKAEVVDLKAEVSRLKSENEALNRHLLSAPGGSLTGSLSPLPFMDDDDGAFGGSLAASPRAMLPSMPAEAAAVAPWRAEPAPSFPLAKSNSLGGLQRKLRQRQRPEEGAAAASPTAAALARRPAQPTAMSRSTNDLVLPDENELRLRAMLETQFGGGGGHSAEPAEEHKGNDDSGDSVGAGEGELPGNWRDRWTGCAVAMSSSAQGDRRADLELNEVAGRIAAHGTSNAAQISAAVETVDEAGAAKAAVAAAKAAAAAVELPPVVAPPEETGGAPADDETDWNRRWQAAQAAMAAPQPQLGGTFPRLGSEAPKAKSRAARVYQAGRRGQRGLFGKG